MTSIHVCKWKKKNKPADSNVLHNSQISYLWFFFLLLLILGFILVFILKKLSLSIPLQNSPSSVHIARLTEVGYGTRTDPVF